jgi:RHS repeat-associated protein
MKNRNSQRTLAMSIRPRFATQLVISIAMLSVTTMSSAQDPDIAEPPPVRESVDANGVDLLTGRMTSVYRGPSIGTGGMSLGVARYFRGAGTWDSYLGTITVSGSTYTVTLGPTTEAFTLSGGTFTPTEVNNGNTLTLSSGVYTYTTRDGTAATFEARAADFAYPSASATLTAVIHPNGARLSVEYENATICVNWLGASMGGCGLWRSVVRIKRVISNYGYKLTITYAEDTVGLTQNNPVLFIRPAQLSLSNLADGSTVGSVGISSTPVSGSQVVELTDSLSRVMRFTVGSNGITGIRRPGSSVDDVSVSYSSGRVSSVNSNGLTTQYAYSDAGSNPVIRTTTVTRAGSVHRVATFDLAKGRMLTNSDGLNRTTTYAYQSDRLHRVTAPEGNYVEYTYDARGNVTQTLLNAKTSSSLSDIITTADFDATCSNAKTCNQPNWTRDAKGNQTDYTYDSTHGGVLTATLPAPSSGAVRPQTRFAYTSLEAWYLNTSGTLAASGLPIHLLTQVSSCRTGSSCANASDEIKTIIGYGSASVPNNRWPLTVESRNGTGTLVSTVTTTFDSAGNVLTVDGPLATNGDTRRARYDALRRVVGAIEPDPDGGSAREPVAVRNTYDTAGRLVLVEKGTVDSQSDGDWSSFNAAESVSLDYDAAGRRTRSSLVAGGTTYQVEQISYDTRGRTDCVAMRMNPATFGSLPSACTLATTGSHGPDRITRFTYNAADEVTTVTQGYGTANAIDVTTRTYTDNGRVETLADGKGNRTTYEYDGFDRLFKTRFPDPASPGSSSSSDYEERAYDENSNLTDVRLRNDTDVTLDWDNLNRLILKDLPEGDDVYFAYDNHGRMLSARYGSTSGNGILNEYDGLGRLASRATFGLGLSYDYDAAHRRTRITHPDSFYAEYFYNAADELTSIVDSGSVTLASFSYDSLGRRSEITRANGTSTTFDYDPVSRLETLTQNVDGTAHDGTMGFQYAPSAQIASRSQSNDAVYTWMPVASGSVSKTHNGLNQLTQTGSTTVTHDDLGNLETGESSFTYGFDNENRMRSAETVTDAVSLTYDPLGMLNDVTTNGTSRELLYDGVDLVAEYEDDVLLRRYVHGPGRDEPLVWYEGSGTSDRRYLHADERGSIMAVTDGAGAAIETFKYSPDGDSTNAADSRFGYTGQAYLDELGVYYYKSRMYSPSIARFLQTDGIGYAGGMNLYAYVRSDPINSVDPLGYTDDDMTVVNWINDNEPTFMGGITVPGDPWDPMAWLNSLDIAGLLNTGLSFDASAAELMGVMTVVDETKPSGTCLGRDVSSKTERLINGPDFVAVSIPVLSLLGVSMTFDRHGQLYVGPAVGLGYPAAGASAGLISDSPTVFTSEGYEGGDVWSHVPSAAETRNFLSGFGASMGAVLGLGVNVPADDKDARSSLNLMTPGVGFSYSFDLGTGSCPR